MGQRFSQLPEGGALGGSEIIAMTKAGVSSETTTVEIAALAAAPTGAAIKAAYEGEPDTNAFDDIAQAKLAAIEPSATADQTGAEIAAAYAGQVAQITAPEIAAGTEAAVRRMSPADIKALIEAHGLTSQAYDLGLEFPGAPASDEVVGRWYVLRSVTLAANFAGSGGAIDTAPTATLDLDVQDDGVSIGTVSISPAGAFTFTTVGGTAKVVDAGSVVQLVAPAVPDATGAGVLVTLKGVA